MDSNKEKKHGIKLAARKKLEMSGVTAVDRFDRDRFDVQTDCGAATILGQNLHIKTLNLEQGILIIEGYVVQIRYSEGRQGRSQPSWIGRMFR